MFFLFEEFKNKLVIITLFAAIRNGELLAREIYMLLPFNLRYLDMEFVKLTPCLILMNIRYSAMNGFVDTFKKGGIIAYPTEAVFGLGCDPDNDESLNQLLKLKKRPVEKGLILLAGNFEQLLPYIDISHISQKKLNTILSRWPDGITQILPKNKGTSLLLTGDFDTIAVRVTSQPDVVALCAQTHKPIVSTSANLSGLEPAKTWQTLDSALTVYINYVVKGQTLGHTSPSKIIDALTGNVIRD